MPGELYAAEGLWRWLGHVVQLGGLVLIVRSASMLDVLELAGIRQVSEATDRRALADGVRAGQPTGATPSLRRPVSDGSSPALSRVGPRCVWRA